MKIENEKLIKIEGKIERNSEKLALTKEKLSKLVEEKERLVFEKNNILFNEYLPVLESFKLTPTELKQLLSEISENETEVLNEEY